MRWGFNLLALAVAACGPLPEPAPAPAAPAEKQQSAFAEAATETFQAIEPTEVGVIAAPTVSEAIAPLIKGFPDGDEGRQALSVEVRRVGSDYVADVLRGGLLDDAIAAEHVRIEFRKEPEGWFPTNAYRRQLCRRGDGWSAEPCP